MAPVMIILLVLTLVALGLLAFLLVKRNKEYNALRTKYKDIIDLNAYKDQVKVETDKLIAQKNADITTLEKQIGDIKADYVIKRGYYDKLTQEISLYEEQQDIMSYGLYKPHFDFDTSEKYKEALLEIREKEKELIKNGTAAVCTQQWKVNESYAEGAKKTKQFIKLILRAFNGESDALVADVRWNNILVMEERLKKSVQAINKLGAPHCVYITQPYYDLKVNELRLAFEYDDKKHKEKEEQRRIQEQMREEEKAQREIEKAIRDAETEETRYSKALEQARAVLEKATGEQLKKMRERIDQLEKEAERNRINKERALSMAQQTKRGNIYIISNIGSFGENVFKIGMTRRLEPMDRVRELGDASVPFLFDVHGIIWSEDAPKLENLLHKEFDTKKINMVNDRREFFRVTIDEIERVVKNYDAKIELTKIAEAREFKESNAIMENLIKIPVVETKAGPDELPVSI
jgi:hypothetical protein